MTQPPQQTPRPSPSAGRADLVVLAVEAGLVAAAALVGAVLNQRGVRLHADAAPLYASWHPHVGWGTPAALLVAVAVVRWGPPLARRLGWRPLLAAGYAAAVAWTLALALVDGWSTGLARRLTPQAEYLWEVKRVTDIPAMLAGFTGRILDFQPDSWATHTAGHPPGALLVFVWLDRLGLGGGAAAALLCVLVGGTVAVSVPVTLRALGDEAAARAVLPFLVLLPGAVWVGASADGIFAGVVAAGLALLALPGRWAAVPAGLLLGFALYLSYGLVLVGPLAVVVLALRPGRAAGAVRTGLLAAAGVLAVVLAFTLAGFDWWTGYRLVAIRYDQGWAADRPYGYWVWANLAALVCSAGPAAAPAVRRAVTQLRGARGATAWLRRGGPTAWLPLAAALAVLAADASGFSKAEVERIWLPFLVWLLVATARLPESDRRRWLAAQAVTALAVNHLLLTVS
ncbi:hypothetical protein ACFFWC_01130 [Plantactinospora siamensis]|uniref:Integral membrane protein n=1 Tax=Plantactinospora siamensis TaxID=555372 RepID=A0ABV6NTC4_9ACTN